MKIYEVGGAVRDRLLGLPIRDRDYVVVGATPQEMMDLGYKPVGNDFPVFLHPETHEEYALARTERKSGHGYQGFTFYTDPGVTLEQDLRRRDLTINAIASTPDGLELTDPFHGQADLEARLLRHVSESFLEDPVRILRVARFAARYAALGFRVADETMALMRTMVADGEANHLVAERVWQELAKGLMEQAPLVMFSTLAQCGALASLLPEVVAAAQADSPAGLALTRAATTGQALPVRFGALTHTLSQAELAALCERLRVPADCRDLARLAIAHHAAIGSAATLPAKALLDILQASDARRRPERFQDLLTLCEIIHGGGPAGASYAPRRLFTGCIEALQAVNEQAISQRPDFQPDMIAAARLAAIEQFLERERT